MKNCFRLTCQLSAASTLALAASAALSQTADEPNAAVEAYTPLALENRPAPIDRSKGYAGVAQFGLGYTSDSYAVYENPSSIYNFGFGGRYNVFAEQNVWVGMDIARGPDDWNWYIQVGHPW